MPQLAALLTRLDDFTRLYQRRWITWFLLVSATTLPLVAYHISAGMSDVSVYHEAMKAMRDGKALYSEYRFEYPPYSLLGFFFPSFFTANEQHFRVAFSSQLLLLDVTLKIFLLSFGTRVATGLRAYLPFAIFATAGLLQRSLLWRRFDLIPAALCLLALWLIVRRAPGWAGALVGLAAGVKLYPAVLCLPLAALCVGQARLEQAGGPGAPSPWRTRFGVFSPALRFAAGIAVAGLPLLLLTLFVPWWDFLRFHTERGLQVESLYASVLWFLHFFGLDVQWMKKPSWYDVVGPSATMLLPMARMLFAGTVLVSVGVSTVSFWRRPTSDLSELARRIQLPLVAFITFNTVLSPQFMLWITCLLALAAMSKRPTPILLLVLAAVFTGAVYPSHSYSTGYLFRGTLALLTRNGLLCAAWGMLLWEEWRRFRECPSVCRV